MWYFSHVFMLMLLLSFSGQVFSHGQQCQENFTHKSIVEVIDKIEESPFAVACHNPPGLLKGRPSTGLLRRSVIEKDSKGRTSREFLKKVSAKIHARIEENRKRAHKIQKCLKSSLPYCRDVNQWVHQDLPFALEKARSHLILSQSAMQVKSWVGRVGKLNSELDLLGSYKNEPWASATPAEMAEAKKMDLEENKKIELECKKQKTKCTINEERLKYRLAHFNMYLDYVNKEPILQFLRGPKVDDLQLKVALHQMDEKLKLEADHLERYDQLLNNPSELDNKLLGLMQYGSIVEEVLMENPQDCGLATSLLYTMNNVELENNLAAGLPILVGTAFASPMLAMAIGVGGGTIFTFDQYSSLKENEEHYLGYLKSDSQDGGTEKLNESRSVLDNTITGVGLGLAVKFLSVRNVFFHR